MIEKLTDIKGIGEKRAELLKSLGVETPQELLCYAPSRYMDFTHINKLAEANDGEVGAFCVEVLGRPQIVRAKGLQLVICRVADSTGKAQITWFNQPYRAGAYKEGETIYLYGKADVKGNTRKFSSPSVYKENPVIVPVYPLKRGITQSLLRNTIRELICACRGSIAETLPQNVLEKYSLMGYEKALFALHFPGNTDDIASAKRRMAFEDMMLFRTAMNYMRIKRKKTAGIAFNTKGVLSKYKKMLSFELTEGQLDVIADIERDMGSAHAMNRLVQGDVGSGKTAVAMYAMRVAAENGMQAALLAPTEILAVQHFTTLCNTFGSESVCLLTGSNTKKQKMRIYEQIASGEYLYIVGTHALLQEGLEFKNLGLLVCDEQQRFGVEQRTALKKKGRAADVLVMSATPIPRTLALVLYGDVDVSKINGMPKGRQKVRTRIVPSLKRIEMYKYLEREAAEGRQVYVVCPQIEDEEGELTAENVTAVHKELSALLSVNVGILHGKMRAAEKNEAIDRFRSGEIKILVSTTVIEVGVDVPSAAHMVIESAERFGLSQLHQLRGRIGRGAVAGYCFLLSDKGTECERLEALVRTSDGFEIAERDLELRGPGQFLGSVQHGESELAQLVPACDMETLIAAKEAADALMIGENEFASEIVTRALKEFNMTESDFCN